jgi:hypothetical protein
LFITLSSSDPHAVYAYIKPISLIGNDSLCHEASIDSNATIILIIRYYNVLFKVREKTGHKGRIFERAKKTTKSTGRRRLPKSKRGLKFQSTCVFDLMTVKRCLALSRDVFLAGAFIMKSANILTRLLLVWLQFTASSGAFAPARLGSTRTHRGSSCNSSSPPLVKSGGNWPNFLASFHQTDSNAKKNVVNQLVYQLAQESPNATYINECIPQLEELGKATVGVDENDSSRFERVIGLYNVSFVQTRQKDENPVGGRWTRSSGFAQKILRTRRTLQHVLPANDTGCARALMYQNRKVVAEAINVIVLEAFNGWIRTTILLRGDCVPLNTTERIQGTCQPLSPLAVRVWFDAPRIIIGRTGRFFNLNVGPQSSVVLDTPFVDERVRLGLGGRSGTRFVFARCDTQDTEATAFRTLLQRKPWSKVKTLSILIGMCGVGIYSAIGRAEKPILGGAISVFSALFAMLIAFSSGGIEQENISAKQALE